MQVRFFTKAGYHSYSIIKLALGPVMWRCSNAERTPRFKQEWSLGFRGSQNCIQQHYFLLPALELQTWQKSCLASIEELGTEYHTTCLTIHLLKWELDIYIARSKNNKVGSGSTAP
jgi:hypothetical protein